MVSSKQFDHKFNVLAPIECVIDFHKDPRTLKILTPPPVFVTFNVPDLNPESTISDFNLWFGPFPVRWVAEILPFESSQGFLDRQVQGPFEFWEHRHTFREIDSNVTQIIDQIKARPGKKFFEGFISRFMWFTLPMLFAYRAMRTRRELEENDS